MAYEALMRSDMEALRSPATIMKLAQEQGALCEIERLTFFKSLETFDHPRNMQIIAEGVETAAELRKVIELGADALQGYFLAKPAAVPAKMAPAASPIGVSKETGSKEIFWISLTFVGVIPSIFSAISSAVGSLPNS